MLMQFKRILRKLGYDVKKYHPLFDTLLKKHEISTIIDIGANTGQFAENIHKKLPSAQIYSFEPLKDCYENLLEKFKSVKNFRAWNIGLGDKNEDTLISRSSFSPSSSFLRMSVLHKRLFPKSEDSVDEKVTMRRLDDLYSELNLTGNILIKVDVQGFEDKVIRGGTKVFSKAKFILIETSFTPLYDNQPLFGDINSLLGELGFKYVGHDTQHWNKETDEPIYEDSLYVKK